MQQAQPLNLLIACESQAQLEACLALFREAGHLTRAHRVSSLRDLGELLRDPQWDLLIATDRHPEITPREALDLLASQGSPLSCLVRMADPRSPGALECLRHGASEVVGDDEDERLLFAVRRDTRSARARRELETLRVQYEETARRAELLLAASQDAIAYVVDGMHVHANELYAGLFGYAGVDDLASVPLVDLIAPDRQKEFKEALRRYRANPGEQTAIDFTGVRADGAAFPGQLTLSTAKYEGEPCMQVLVRPAPAAPASGGGGASQAVPCGVDALRKAVTATPPAGYLLLLALDGYPQHCRLHGVTRTTRMVEALATHLAQAGRLPAHPIRAAEAVLALPCDADRAACAELARRLVEEVAAFSPPGAPDAQCAATVVAAPLEGAADTGADALIDRAWAALVVASERAGALAPTDGARVQLLESPTAAAASAGAVAHKLADDLRDGAFRILFQPIVSLRGDTTEYYEVHVSRADGQPAAQWVAGAGLGDATLELDKWVVIESLKKLSLQRDRNPSTRLIVPVGAGALLDADFGQWLAMALRGAELPADSIVVQVSHHAVATHLAQARHLAERLRALGCQLSVSDVHIVNNPVSDLLHLRPQLARIDAALAPALKDNESTNTLLKPLIESLHQEQVASIMPNVEGAGMLAVLWQLGVNYIQGDYLQTPQPEMHYDFTDLA